MQPPSLDRPEEHRPSSGGTGPEGGVTRPRGRSWLRRLYVTLRTEHTTPAKVGAGVALGVFVGCSPLWGLHLPLCVLLATIFRLNRVLVYAAANAGNPVTAAPILFAEIQIGHRLLQGGWLPVRVHEIEVLGLQGLVASLVLGSLVVGAACAVVCGTVAWVIARTGSHQEPYRDIADAIVVRYADVSIRDAEAARAALFSDPIYPFLLQEGFHRRGMRVLDLGCGRGLAGALAGLLGASPRATSYLGVDSRERYVRAARLVLEEFPGCGARAVDLRDFDPPEADLVLVDDVLRFLPLGAQDALLRRVARAVPPGARMIVREKNAGGGWRFHLAALGDSLAALRPGHGGRADHYRRAEDLRNALIAAGFSVVDRTLPRSHAGWVILDATRRPGAARA